MQSAFLPNGSGGGSRPQAPWPLNAITPVLATLKALSLVKSEAFRGQAQDRHGQIAPMGDSARPEKRREKMRVLMLGSLLYV